MGSISRQLASKANTIDVNITCNSLLGNFSNYPTNLTLTSKLGAYYTSTTVNSLLSQNVNGWSSNVGGYHYLNGGVNTLTLATDTNMAAIDIYGSSYVTNEGTVQI